MKSILSIFCRSVGPGGTSVDFYPTATGVKAVWTNENCPYTYGEDVDIDDTTSEASDGHNVSLIGWDELRSLLQYAPAREGPGLRRQPKREFNKKRR